jgi:hypothetical protein
MKNQDNESSNWIWYAVIIAFIISLLMSSYAQASPNKYTSADYGSIVLWGGVILLCVTMGIGSFYKKKEVKKTLENTPKVTIDWEKKYNDLKKSTDTTIASLQASIKEKQEKITTLDKLVKTYERVNQAIGGK